MLCQRSARPLIRAGAATLLVLSALAPQLARTATADGSARYQPWRANAKSASSAGPKSFLGQSERMPGIALSRFDSPSDFPRPGDYFGEAVAISGPVAVVGAWDSDPARNAAYIYTRSRSGWRRQSALPHPAKWNGFGGAVGVSKSTHGTFVVVGAPDANNYAGEAYIFVPSGRKWHLQAALKDPGPKVGTGVTNGDRFGTEVAVSGQTVLVSAPTGDRMHGVVYVFGRSRGSWHLYATIRNPAAPRQFSFGSSVALSGNTALIGEWAGKGVARVYVRAGRSWHRQATITCACNDSNPAFSSSVALSGNVAVIGAEGVPDGYYRGAAYIYVRAGTVWRRRAVLPDPRALDGDAFGSSVAVSGRAVVVGAPSGSPDPGLCGAAYAYSESGRSWVERAQLAEPTCSSADGFGASVGISGKTAVIGAPFKNHGAGQVYVLTVP